MITICGVTAVIWCVILAIPFHFVLLHYSHGIKVILLVYSLTVIFEPLIVSN
uniref:Uncharacterized protein n=1 Tax=Setaria italica TaxID=4555 RepID=K3YP16_SETIT